jgi:serine/threonine protein kinase
VPDVSEGSVVDGRYRILRRLGSGGMADVWLAEDTHLQRQVALKVLHRRFAQDQEFVQRFQREAESAARLQHPNIVSVFDRGQFDGTYYIAMQYVDGPTLKQLIDRGLSTEQAVGLIRQVLEAARFAHRNGVVHRDLKPQNVIVDGEGKAVVTDFGIARAGVSEITQTGSVMGTPHYLSPEQAQGFDVTAVSDLYSVGVILY